MKKLALGVIFSLFICLGPAVNAMVLKSNGVEVNNLPDDDKKKKKKSCDSSNKEACTKEKKKSCCTDKTMKEEPKK